MLGLFQFEDEVIVSIHRVPFHLIEYEQHPSGEDLEHTLEHDGNTQGIQSASFQIPKITVQNYVSKHKKTVDDPIKKLKTEPFFDFDDRKVFEHEFPVIELDKCYVVTNHSLYCIELK